VLIAACRGGSASLEIVNASVPTPTSSAAMMATVCQVVGIFDTLPLSSLTSAVDAFASSVFSIPVRRLSIVDKRSVDFSPNDRTSSVNLSILPSNFSKFFSSVSSRRPVSSGGCPPDVGGTPPLRAARISNKARSTFWLDPSLIFRAHCSESLIAPLVDGILNQEFIKNFGVAAIYAHHWIRNQVITVIRNKCRLPKDRNCRIAIWGRCYVPRITTANLAQVIS